jgi:hypothetical protein
MKIAVKSAVFLAIAALVIHAQAASAQTTVQFSVNAQQSVKAISPLIYGANADISGRWANLNVSRSGGNRLTAYNWENNDSNAGSDWYFQNDGLMSSSTNPGQAMRGILNTNNAAGAATVLTIPMAGYVSADRLGNGDVRYVNGGSTPDPTYLSTRFKVSRPTDPLRGTNPFPSTPNTSDGFVNQDEFVNWVKTNYPNTVTDPNRQVIYDLDNEPDLWSGTHAEIHPTPVTYAELTQKTTDYAKAIKAVSPNAIVMGPVSYGWYGYTTLQGASDAGGRDFVTYYLQQMAAAHQAAGKRLVDALDLHWYPEAYGTVRITENNTDAATVAARLQAPRDLWDPTYKTENSWIQNSIGNNAIQLIPREQAKIDANYAGTKIAISEYSYGAGYDISGGIAEADVLGIFGKQGVFEASYWSVSSGDQFVQGAFDMFLNYNGTGGHFGDTSVAASTNDVAATSVYASVDSTDPTKMVLMAINKTDHAITANFNLNGKHYTLAQIFQLTGASSYAQAAGTLSLNGLDTFSYSMPAYSVSTLELVPEPASLSLLALGALGLIRRRRR